jgi:hypothetical protein
MTDDRPRSTVPPHPATCPLCHAVAADVTAAHLAAGSGWRCATCDQRWDAARLATVAAYARFVAERARP